jgi:type IV pilus assembly protein PilC
VTSADLICPNLIEDHVKALAFAEQAGAARMLRRPPVKASGRKGAMPDYAYVALDLHGRENRGVLRTTDPSEACQRLKEMGLFPTKVFENKAKAPAQRSAPLAVRRQCDWTKLLGNIGGRVRPKALTAFTRQLATLVEAGMPLLRGLRLLQQQETDRTLKRVTGGVIASVEDGAAFSEALAQHPKVFNRLYLNMVKAGEVSGALEIVLQRLAGFMEKAQRIKGKVIAALFYPATVITVAIGIITLMLAFVLPKFQEVFKDFVKDGQMPPFTDFVFGLSTAVKSHFPLTAGMVAVLAVSLTMFVRTRLGRQMLDLFKLRMPVLGPVFTKAAIARFTRTLGTLVNSGVPILQALTIVKETAGNVIIGNAVAAVHESVKEGETIADPLRVSGVFPAVMVGMVDVGEQTGALPEMLLKIADIYEDEVDNAVAAMTSLLEPLLIIFLAVVVGSIVIALYLPILDIVTQGDFDRSDGGAADRDN